ADARQGRGLYKNRRAHRQYPDQSRKPPLPGQLSSLHRARQERGSFVQTLLGQAGSPPDRWQGRDRADRRQQDPRGQSQEPAAWKTPSPNPPRSTPPKNARTVTSRTSHTPTTQPST